jgi:hypothetical protein
MEGEENTGIDRPRFRRPEALQWSLLIAAADKHGISIEDVDHQIHRLEGIRGLRGPKWNAVLSLVVAQIETIEAEQRLQADRLREHDERGLQVYVGSRASGKTYRAVEWVRANEGAVIMCASASRAMALKQAYGLTDDQVIGPDRQRLGRQCTAVFIDNAEELLRGLIGPHDVLAGISIDGYPHVLHRWEAP